MEATGTNVSSTNIASFLSGLMSFLLTTTFLVLCVIISLYLLYWFSRKASHKKSVKTHTQSKMVFLTVKVPPESEQKESSMEELLRSLHTILPNNSFLSLEMSSVNQFLSFTISIPDNLKNILESQVYAQYPAAVIEENADPLPIVNINSAAAELNFKRSSINPLKTYHNNEEDFLKILSALLSKTETGEQVYFQLELKRVGSKLLDRGFGAYKNKQFSKKTEENQATPSSNKLSQDLFLGKLRIIFTAVDTQTAKSKLNSLVNIFKVAKSPVNELKTKDIELRKATLSSIQTRVFNGGDLWMPAEIATLYHFPYKGSVVSNVVQTTSKYAPPPETLPYEGLVNPTDVSIFGETNFRNERKRFGIKRIDRRRHLYVVGKTGSGKSRLIELLFISDIFSGQGCCLLDPHGDLAEELLKFIPKERIKDVVYIDPSDREFPIGFNPLEPVDDYETRQHLATFFISIFRKLFASTWNPRMEHLIRFITLALLETPDSSVLGIPRILSDTPFRQRVVMQIKDPVVKAFWTNEFSVSADQYSREAVVPILNKVGQFISNPIVRNMIGQRKNMLDFTKFMDEGKIVIINISKGKLGDDNAALLGSMFITKIQQATLARAKVPEEERRDFYFYVDEFQNFATDAFSTILSEARKYHLNLTIAHQYIAQLPEEVKATAFGNVGSLVIFPIGGDDAAYLVKEFSPTFTADDMTNLYLREMYIKMSIDGKLTPPFSAKTIDVPKPPFDYSKEILSHSRLTYGKSRVSVENEIKRWTESSESVSELSKEEFPEPII